MRGAKNADNRIRVQRMLAGRCREDDLKRLMLSLRQRSYGCQIVKDIADLIAHEDERDQGLIVDTISQMYFCFKLFYESRNQKFDVGRLPNYFENCVYAAIQNAPSSLLKKNTGFKRGAAYRTAKSACLKFNTNADGTIDASDCTAEERRLLLGVAGVIVVRPVYDGAKLFKQVTEVLTKNKLLHVGEASDFGQVSACLSLMALSLLNRANIVMPDDSIAELSCGFSSDADGQTLEVNASWPADGKLANLRFSVCIFQTNLYAGDHCEPDLLAAAQYSNDIPGNPGSWSEPIEVGEDWKLRLMTV